MNKFSLNLESLNKNNSVLTSLPAYQRLWGEMSQTRVLRLALCYLGLVALGSGLVLGTSADYWQRLGLGLIVPGGGFFANGTTDGLLLSLVSTLIFVIALAIWFGTGNVLAPVAVWLGAAVLAASFSSGAGAGQALADVFGLVGVAIIALTFLLTTQFWTAKHQRQTDNAYLPSQQNRIAYILVASVPDGLPEMALADLQRLNFALDRALQPVAEFNGFEWLDQFQTAAVRYQLNFLAYSLALTQARYTPACGAYLHEAQANLLAKQTDYRVWRYWGLENWWGNLNSDPDPLKRDNIMYTGFVALQMALFEASTGRYDFSQPGSFSLHHPSGRQYRYCDADFISRLESEYQRSAFFLIACEPNWVYPLCNMMGACAVQAYDALRQQRKWPQYQDAFREHLESEFLDAFGRYVPCRSTLTGLALPAFGGAMPLAMPCFFLNAIAPDLALRQWLLLRRRLFDAKGRFRRTAFWRIDTGNYRFSRASAYAATALAAAELGDGEVLEQCWSALEDECPSVLVGNVSHRQRASVWSHGVEIMARSGCKNGFRDLLTRPCSHTGLRLDRLDYQQVMVASAHANGQTLTAVLYPRNRNGIYPLGVAGLMPNRHYRVSGAITTPLTADGDGSVHFDMPLAGRTLLRICPAEML